MKEIEFMADIIHSHHHALHLFFLAWDGDDADLELALRILRRAKLELDENIGPLDDERVLGIVREAQQCADATHH